MIEEAPQLAADLAHLRRQIALCRRLIGMLHQPDLVGRLQELQAEYEVRMEDLLGRQGMPH
jgi:hypothetical protein